MATIYQESKFIGNARTPFRYALGVIPMGRQSSAYGYAQALDGTWDDYRRATGRWGAKRDRIRDATDFMGWYMHETTERLGIAKHDARNQYLAYHEGRTGYARGSYNAKPWLLRVNTPLTSSVSVSMALSMRGPMPRRSSLRLALRLKPSSSVARKAGGILAARQR